jgi:hypothetical protein
LRSLSEQKNAKIHPPSAVATKSDFVFTQPGPIGDDDDDDCSDRGDRDRGTSCDDDADMRGDLKQMTAMITITITVGGTARGKTSFRPNAKRLSSTMGHPGKSTSLMLGPLMAL